MIYSSGVNNLMREVGNNPFDIRKDYKKRFDTPNYNYTYSKAKDEITLNNVMEGIERNFDNIYNINDKTDVYTLGSYIPKSLESEGMDVFRTLISKYNERLKQLCEKYHITYVDTELIGKNYNNSGINFHITAAGHNALANAILSYMYQNKIVNFKDNIQGNINNFICTNRGSEGIIDATYQDYEKNLYLVDELENYEKQRAIMIAKEHLREKAVFEHVKKKCKTIYIK